MSFGSGPFGSFPYGSDASEPGAPYLYSSSPVHNSANNAADVALSFILAATSGVIAASLDVRVNGIDAIIDGVFQAGWAGTVTPVGIYLMVDFSAHPDFDTPNTGVTIFAQSVDLLGAWMAFSFGVNREVVSELKAKTGCDGKRIDLYFTVPDDVTRIKIRRSRYNFCSFDEDPGDTLYEGAPTNLDATPMDLFVDGVFADAVHRTTNTSLEENSFYYYSVFVSYSTSAPYHWVINKDAQVEGLSIKDYFALYGHWVYDLLPPNYRTRDGDPNRGTERYRLRDYCRVIQCGANLQRGWLEALLHLRDPDNTPAGQLEIPENQTGLLAAHAWDLGFPPERSFDAGVLRRVVLGIVPIYKIKGTCPGLVDLAKMFAGWDARCDEQIEPYCGVTRLFSLWDNESKIFNSFSSSVDVDVTIEGEVTFTPSRIRNGDGDVENVPTTASGEPTVAFILDVFGTFVCVESVTEAAGSYTFHFTEPHAKLRTEITGSGTGALNSFTITSVDVTSWPWQFSSEEPEFMANAFKGLQLIDSAGTQFLVQSSLETNASGDTVLTVAGTPATGVFGLSAFYTGVTYAARVPYWKGYLYIGEFSLTVDPAWDIRLMAEGMQGPWTFLTGFGSINTLGFTSTPADVVVWVQDAHEYLSYVTTAGTNYIIDELAEWEIGEFRGHYLLPNWNQSKLYRIVDNTDTTLVLDVGDGAGVDTVTAARFRYVILNEASALKYSQLMKLMPSFIPHESRGFIKFERAFEPEDVSGLLFDFRADRGLTFDTYPDVRIIKNYGSVGGGALQATAANQPDYMPDYGDHAPALVGDVTDYMAAGASATMCNGSFTIFILSRIATYPAGADLLCLYGAGIVAAASPFFGIKINSAGNALGLLDDVTSGTLNTATVAFPLNQWNIVMLRYDRPTDTTTFRVNDTEVQDSAIGLTETGMTLEVHSFMANATFGTVDDQHPNDFRRLLVYNAALTEPEIEKVFRYLREEYPGV